MLPRLVIGQRSIDIDEYNARFERKNKHMCCNSNNSLSYFFNNCVHCGENNNDNKKKCTTCKFSTFTAFFAIIAVAVLLLLFHNTSSSTSTITETEKDGGGETKMSISDAEILKSLTILKSEINKVQERIRYEWRADDFPIFYRLTEVPFHSWQTQSSNNYFKDAYPQIFYDTMNPVMEKLKGVKLVVRNHAIGNNPCYPYDACVATHMGDDVDVLTWEQSMNCGRDIRPITTFCNVAQSMPKKPSVFFFLSGTPGWKPEDCKGVKPTPIPKSHKPVDATYLAQTTNLMTAMTFLSGEGVSIPKTFQHLAPMGPYSSNFSAKSTGGGAPWHPGVLGHKLRGESMAFVFLRMMHDAADELIDLLFKTEKRVFKTTSTDDLVHSLLSRLIGALRIPIAQVALDPVAKALKKSLSDNPNLTTQTGFLISLCFDILTRWKAHSLSGPPLVPPKFNINETATLPQCFTEYKPSMKNPLSGLTIKAMSSWSPELAFFDKAAVDRAFIFSSAGYPGSVLALKIVVPNSLRNPLWLCELQKAADLYSTSLPFDPNLLSLLNQGAGNLTAAAESHKALQKIELLPFVDQCYRTKVGLSKGEHALLLKQKGLQKANLAYLVVW
eukprot:gene31899-41389_t